MNLLPSMLIATTLLGSGTNVQANLSAADIDALLKECQEVSFNGQIIAGNAEQLADILKNMGVDIDSLYDCIFPGLPDVELPGGGNDTPDAETPDNGNDTPDTELPDDGDNTPDAGLPTPTPDPDNKPGTGTPDTEEDASQSYVEQVVALVNAERAKVNLPALTMSMEVNRAAQIRAKETVQSFSHTRPNGSSFSTVLKENGISYRGAGENIAWGQRTPEEVVNAWMNSEGHRANILNKNYTTIGVGYHLNGSTPYWAQLFTY